MIIKIFGILDLLAALSLFLLKFDFGTSAAFFLGVYLVIKGVIFFRSFASFMDLLSGCFLLYTLYFGFTNYALIFVLWLLQKGIVSLF